MQGWLKFGALKKLDANQRSEPCTFGVLLGVLGGEKGQEWEGKYTHRADDFVEPGQREVRQFEAGVRKCKATRQKPRGENQHEKRSNHTTGQRYHLLFAHSFHTLYPVITEIWMKLNDVVKLDLFDTINFQKILPVFFLGFETISILVAACKTFPRTCDFCRFRHNFKFLWDYVNFMFCGQSE